jgi:hypothetical protein
MTKEKIIGKFKPKVKFIKFVALSGNITFQSNEAVIQGKYLSGIDMDGVDFKLSLRDNDTVDFEEINDDKRFTEAQKSRFLELICEKNIGFLKNHSVLTDLPFTTTLQNKEINLYLEVEYQSPFDKLVSLFDEGSNEVTDYQKDKLDDLLSMFEDDEPEVTQESELESNPESIKTNSEEIEVDLNKSIKESFDKMKNDKIVELQRILDLQESELQRFLFEKNQAEKKISTAEKEIKSLESRIENLKPIADPNGYCFFVSERMNEKIELDEVTKNTIFNAVSKVKSINAEAFMKLFEQGEFQIRLGTKSSDSYTEVVDYKIIPEEIKNFLAKNSILKVDNKLIYSGDLTWHEIVNKMIKAGFVQNSDFDKLCGSNSYQVTPDEKSKS